MSSCPWPHAHCGDGCSPSSANLALKFPCPVRNCDTSSPIANGKLNRRLMSGKQLNVHLPFGVSIHRDCHESSKLSRVTLIVSVLRFCGRCLTSSFAASQRNSRSNGGIPARTCKAAVEVVLYAPVIPIKALLCNDPSLFIIALEFVA